jgi:GNAT superfamily N-acetyltransferase
MIVRIAAPDDLPLLRQVADGVFDDAVVPSAAVAFLGSDRHHLAIAVEHDRVIGMASAVHYVHPDKPAPELWINEVGVADSAQGRGVGRLLVDALAARGRALGCATMWVLTSRDNAAARALYAGRGGRLHPDETLMYEWDLRVG